MTAGPEHQDGPPLRGVEPTSHPAGRSVPVPIELERLRFIHTNWYAECRVWVNGHAIVVLQVQAPFTVLFGAVRLRSGGRGRSATSPRARQRLTGRSPG